MIQRSIVLCALVFGINLTCATAASAWSGGEVDYQQGTTDNSAYNAEVLATQPQQNIQFVGEDEQVHEAVAQVTIGKSVRLAYMPLSSRWVISIGGDALYHYFSASYLYTPPTLIAGTNKLVLPLRSGAMDGYNLYVSDDISRDIVPVLGLRGQIIRYDISSSTMQAFLSYQDSKGSNAKAYFYDQVFSRNKRFGVFWLGWRDFVRVDFKTGEIRAFLQRAGSWYDGIYMNRASAITNDGRYVFMNNGMSVVDVRATCGQIIDPGRYNGTVDQNYTQCPERQFDPAPLTGYDGWHQSFYLAPNERSFSYWLAPYPYTNGSAARLQQKITVSINTTHEGIDYLALGDSYSSGEGDIEKNADGTNFYLPMTDIGSDMCHVSSRSYPYLLRDYWGIDEANMKSVACSGARVVFDYYRPLSGYLGQGDRLAGRQDISAVQQNSIERFIPGRVPQLEFVKKYQPAVVTLTGGGNDVGFADVLKYCAFGSPLDNDVSFLEMVTEGLYGISTCAFAQKGSQAQKIISTSIAEQYLYTSRLIKSIKQASPDTQIYVVGYPSFISEGTAVCGNSLELDSQERAAFEYYLRNLNYELARASSDENVAFIDIKDSLIGGRLCEGSEYVTGSTNVIFSGGASLANMFHPNAKGHEKIAAAIELAIENGSIPDPDLPGRPDSVSGDTYDGTVINMPLINATITNNGSASVNIESGLFADNVTVRAKLYSDVIDLGTLKTQANGAIKSTLSYSSLPIGFHMLTLEGMGEDGEPLLLYQFVTVEKGTEAAAESTAATGANGAQSAASQPVGGSSRQPGEKAILRVTNNTVSSPIAESVQEAIAAAPETLAKTIQSTAASNSMPQQLLIFLFGLCSGVFIMTAWSLTRRAREKAKSNT